MLSLVLVFGCKPEKKTQSSIVNRADLTRIWVHSYEDDFDGVKVYRTPKFDFPPARGREKMALKPDGALTYRPISANDCPVSYDGAWQISGAQLVLEYEGIRIERTILSLENEILKLK